MRHPANVPLVRTIKEHCRTCYTCVRECPAKAIRIVDGQAEVIAERCIGCGNCVRVCSQGAKLVLSSKDEVAALLVDEARTVAIIAPSFSAEFTEFGSETLVSMLKAMGFDYVAEVAFGADLVATAYHKLLEQNDGRRYIATSCPGVVAYVERYYPDLVENLAPIVSPMVASARVLHKLHGDDLKVVFIGPCIAKKGEGVSEPIAGEIDSILTFAELREMFHERDIQPDAATPSDFDPPLAGQGALFPISRGMLQAARISEDLMTGQVVAADGRTGFVEAIKEFESGALDARLLEVLCCNGCIMGAGMTVDTPIFSRRSAVSHAVRKALAHRDPTEHETWMAKLSDLDLSRHYMPNDQRIPLPADDALAQTLAQMGKFTPEDELNCGACGYDTCREHAVAIMKGLAESEMCLPYTIEQLRKAVTDLGISHEQLKETQEALMHSEKLASMGQLAAGIAHELNNPLGVVLIYAHLLLDEAEKSGTGKDDLAMIAEQADRCKKIVAGLLHFARQNKVLHQPADVVDLVQRCLSTIPSVENVRLVMENRTTDPIAEIDRDQIVQVLTNLVSNAQAAMPDGGDLKIRIEGDEDEIRFHIIDSGVGIPRENRSKVFEPFFTTKQIGKGTGLGLAVTYGIVKMHSGNISFESNADPKAGPTGTTFTVKLPRRPNTISAT